MPPCVVDHPLDQAGSPAVLSGRSERLVVVGHRSGDGYGLSESDASVRW